MDDGISGIIDHLTKCAIQNEKDAKADAGFEPVLRTPAGAVAAEQRRMLSILKLYRMWVEQKPVEQKQKAVQQ